MKRPRVWLSGLAVLAALPVAAKVDDPNDLIHGRWYATEVIIFERAQPADPGPEALVWEGGRAWPATTRAFQEPEPWRIASLDPLTRACLEFPRLELAMKEPQLGEREGFAPRMNEPQLGEREGFAPRMNEPQLGEREGFAPRMNEPQPGEREGFAPRMNEPRLGEREGGSALPEPIAAVLNPPPAIDPRLAPHPLLDLLSTAARQQQALRRESYRWLPQRTHTLGAQARRLRNTPGLDIIWHGRWLQPVPSRAAGEPLMLAAQATPSQGRLSGTLQITLGRFLHFGAKLWLEQAIGKPCPKSSEEQPPRAEVASCDNPDPRSRQLEGEAAAIPYMRLDQTRTMRSGELHYIDHPRMGVLVRVDPIPASAALEEALETWRQSIMAL